jgi:serine/threonine protein phosphatase 1
MIARLLSRFSPSKAPPPRVDEGTRVYAIGDIHGRVDLLRQLHGQILADAAAEGGRRNVLVYLGDYVDRGAHSCAVLDCLLDEALPGFEAVHLLGNHEDTLLEFLGNVQVGPAWLAFGGGATLKSYGIAPPSSERDLIRAQSELRQRLPARHLEFMRRLKLSHVEGDYYFTHAGVRPGVPLDRQLPQDLLWIRDLFLDSRAAFGKVVVHGHTVVDAPEVRQNRIGIDTGAYASGTLTCLVLADAVRTFLQT